MVPSGAVARASYSPPMTDDPDDIREFTRAETRNYNPRPCPACGQQTMHYAFTEMTDYGSTVPRYLRGYGKCYNGNCVLNGGDEGTMPGR
jgi:hypothetical protein